MEVRWVRKGGFGKMVRGGETAIKVNVESSRARTHRSK